MITKTTAYSDSTPTEAKQAFVTRYTNLMTLLASKGLKINARAIQTQALEQYEYASTVLKCTSERLAEDLAINEVRFIPGTVDLATLKANLYHW